MQKLCKNGRSSTALPNLLTHLPHHKPPRSPVEVTVILTLASSVTIDPTEMKCKEVIFDLDRLFKKTLITVILFTTVENVFFLFYSDQSTKAQTTVDVVRQMLFLLVKLIIFIHRLSQRCTFSHCQVLGCMRHVSFLLAFKDYLWAKRNSITFLGLKIVNCVSKNTISFQA